MDAARKMFEQLDQDGSGSLQREAIAELVANLFPEMSEEKVAEAFGEMDDDSSGQVDIDQFSAWWTVQKANRGADIEARMQVAQAQMKRLKGSPRPKAYESVGEMLDSARGIVFQSILKEQQHIDGHFAFRLRLYFTHCKEMFKNK